MHFILIQTTLHFSTPQRINIKIVVLQDEKNFERLEYISIKMC